jgi:hypothetical protein
MPQCEDLAFMVFLSSSANYLARSVSGNLLRYYCFASSTNLRKP